MLGRPRRCLSASRARRFALGIDGYRYVTGTSMGQLWEILGQSSACAVLYGKTHTRTHLTKYPPWLLTPETKRQTGVGKPAVAL